MSLFWGPFVSGLDRLFRWNHSRSSEPGRAEDGQKLFLCRESWPMWSWSQARSTGAMFPGPGLGLRFAKPMALASAIIAICN